MYEEGVKEYFNAKRMAAKRLFGKGGKQQMQYRPKDLPSNGEIQEALLKLADFHEGEERSHRLFAMRIVALEAMQELGDFHPRLIGSVRSGHVRKGSDIDLHVFSDEPDLLAHHLDTLQWDYQVDEVSIRKNGENKTYLHYYIEDLFPVELTLYPLLDRRFAPRSSTDGKPIVRFKTHQLRDLIQEEHPDAWLDYLQSGTIPHIETFQEEASDSDFLNLSQCF